MNAIIEIIIYISLLQEQVCNLLLNISVEQASCLSSQSGSLSHYLGSSYKPYLSKISFWKIVLDSILKISPNPSLPKRGINAVFPL